MTASKDNAQRRYMDFIQEATNKKEFSVAVLRQKHRISQPNAQLIHLGWVDPGAPGRGNRSKWIGPKPKTNDELFRMAKILRDEVSAYNKAKNDKQLVKNKQEVAPMPKKPRAKKVASKKPRFQILWGLITIW